MARLWLAIAAAALLSGPASAGPQKEAAVPAAPSAHGSAVASVPALGLALGETGSATSLAVEAGPAVAAPAAEAAPQKARTLASVAADVQAGGAAQERVRAAAAEASGAAGEALAAAEDARFDQTASLPAAAAVDAAPMPIAARMHALVPASLRHAPSHPAVLALPRLVLAEEAARASGAALLLGFFSLTAAAVGGFGVLALILTGAFMKHKPLGPRRTLSPAQRETLRLRARARLETLLVRLGLPASDAPTVVVSNEWGRRNMTVTGADISPEARILIGEGWIDESDEQLQAVLAHELGHLARQDCTKLLAGAVGPARLLRSAGPALAAVAALIAWAYRVEPQAAEPLERLALGLSFGEHGPALAAGLLAASLGGAGLLLLSSRLREYLADNYSAHLDGPAGIMERSRNRQARVLLAGAARARRSRALGLLARAGLSARLLARLPSRSAAKGFFWWVRTHPSDRRRFERLRRDFPAA